MLDDAKLAEFEAEYAQAPEDAGDQHEEGWP